MSILRQRLLLPENDESPPCLKKEKDSNKSLEDSSSYAKIEEHFIKTEHYEEPDEICDYPKPQTEAIFFPVKEEEEENIEAFGESTEFSSTTPKNEDAASEEPNLSNENKPYRCDFCPKAFTNIRRLIIHRRLHTGETIFNCQHCDKTFNKETLLIKHSRIHLNKNESTIVGIPQESCENKPYYCDFCTKSFTNIRRLIIHRRTHP